MILGDFYITKPQVPQPKNLIEWVQESCTEIQPKPIYCEIPEDLKFKSVSTSGTTQAYTIVTSMISLPSVYGTSTATTL